MSVGYFIARSRADLDLATHCFDTATHAANEIINQTPDGEWPKDVVLEVLFSQGRLVEVDTVEFK